MKLSLNNYKKITFFLGFLIGISAYLSYFLSIKLKEFGIEIPFYIEIPISAPAIYYILFELFNNYFWKIPVFKWLKIIDFDNLNGVWKGSIRSSYDNYKTDIPAELTIKQNATSIKVRGKFNQSKSISLHEDFCYSEIDQTTALFYFYRNEPDYNAINTMSIHEGSVKLNYNKSSNSITGSYYSDRDRNNNGTINVKKTIE